MMLDKNNQDQYQKTAQDMADAMSHHSVEEQVWIMTMLAGNFIFDNFEEGGRSIMLKDWPGAIQSVMNKFEEADSDKLEK